MRREAFGPLAALNDADLARALVAICASSFRLTEPMSIDGLIRRYPQAFNWHEQRTGEPPFLYFTLPVVALQRYVIRVERLKNAAEALQQWQMLFKGASPPPTRYCLDLSGLRNNPDRQIDLDWLIALLGNESVHPVSVFAAWPSEPMSLEWEWPLRIGIAPGPSAKIFRELLAQRYFYRGMITVVDVELVQARCDVLMFPSSLRDAMRSALGLSSVRASAVLVLGGIDVQWVQANPWLSGLRRQFHSGVVGTCFVPSIERGPWFEAFLEELCRNMTVDHALFQAPFVQSRNEQRWSNRETEDYIVPKNITIPLILADRDFLESTRVAETGKRIGAAAAIAAGKAILIQGVRDWKAPEPSNARFVVGRAPPQRIPDSLPSGDAKALTGFRRAVEAVTRTTLVLPNIVVGFAARPAMVRSPPITVGDFEPPSSEDDFPSLGDEVRVRKAGITVPGPPHRITPMPSDDVPVPMASSARSQRPFAEKRRVQLDVFRAGDNTRQSEVEALTPYRILVFIGVGKQGGVRADTVLNERLLPPSSVGHQIRIVFTPLWKGPEEVIPPAQVQEVHLPATGTSGRAQFHFTTPKDLTDFRARLVLLNQYRVLQTLLLSCPQESLRPTGMLILTEENIVSADYGDTTVAPPFEAALIVNDGPLGGIGLTAIAGGGAQFFEPAGFDKVLKMIRDDLGSLNAPDEESEEIIIGLDDQRVHELMYRLALRGAALAKELKRQPQLGAFLNAPRLQVIDAVSGAFFPVELVYEGKAPVEGAKRCEWSIDALDKQSVHEDCPNRASNAHICPAAFWGFSKCIERQPSNGQQGYGFAQPAQSNNALRPFKSVLFAASRKVRQMDIVPPGGLESVFTEAGMGFGQAKTWLDWTSKIEDNAPSMLVLLPHSLNSAAAADLPALEIGGTEMPSVRIDDSFVHGGGDERPIVLLLGCSTALPDIPFLSFVREFRFNGAAVTVGTLATIRGRQTVEFVKEFLKQLKKVAEEGLTFDEAMLRVKRQMLAKGNPFVLSLVAYGDTGWRIRI